MIYRKESKFSGTYLYIKGDRDTAVEIKEDITGLISVSDKYKDRGIKSEHLKGFLYSLTEEGKRMESEDIDMSGWILDPECIFESTVSDNKSNSFKFFYYYENEKDVNKKYNPSDMLNKKLTALFEYLLWHIDYEDSEAIRISYEAYMRVIRGNYVFEDLWQI